MTVDFNLMKHLHWNYIKTNVKITCLTNILPHKSHSLRIDSVYRQEIITWNIEELPILFCVYWIHCSNYCANLMNESLSVLLVLLFLFALKIYFCLSFNKAYRKLRYWNTAKIPVMRSLLNHERPSSWCCQSKSNFLYVFIEFCSLLMLLCSYQPYHCPTGKANRIDIEYRRIDSQNFYQISNMCLFLLSLFDSENYINFIFVLKKYIIMMDYKQRKYAAEQNAVVRIIVFQPTTTTNTISNGMNWI